MKKEPDLHYFYLQVVKIVEKSENLRKIPNTFDDHNFGTEYAKNVKFVS